MKGFIVSAIAVFSIIVVMAEPGKAFSCGQIDAYLAPCVPYLTQGGTPSLACCNGVKSIKGIAKTTADKREACNCVKDAANLYANLKEDAAQALPDKCGDQMDIKISKSFNCDAIN